MTPWAIFTDEGKGVATKPLLQPLAKYGNDSESLNVQEYWISSRLYMLSLYDGNEFEGNFDALRAHLIGSIKGNMRILPPTKDSFQLHLRRALHQLVICKKAHFSQPSYPDATNFDRHIVNGKLVSIVMLKTSKHAQFARQILLQWEQQVYRSCSCSKANVKCVIVCLHWETREIFKGRNLTLEAGD